MTGHTPSESAHPERSIDISTSEFERVLDELDQPAWFVAPLLQLVERVATRSSPTR